ncbi:cytochrome B [candidate division WOR-1 bacterium RIFCSPLOWO2_02_FULL_46_20]|uniref:Cytochrome B n=2 Tax=Bacteria TaxID=2 RepID=A0A1F4RAV6_UNCSA|nr:MAG: cytochrome B [candidate division WOR-1 bacterium RIFCSPLOWO2_02_FULL_46_20]
MNKPKVSFFDFACCEGCQLQIANMGELLLDVLGAIDVVEFREVMSEKWVGEFDVVFVEGSITTPQAIEHIKRLRARTKTLVAYGSCAAIGGVNGMKNNYKLEDIRKSVYGKDANFFPTVETKAIHQVVKVDYVIPGCPVYLPEVVAVLKAFLAGLPRPVPDNAVCVECKLNENICLYERGVACLGPITRAGCNSWCINHGNICYGCRGLVSNPNTKGAKDILEKYSLSVDLIANKMNMYNKCGENDNRE